MTGTHLDWTLPVEVTHRLPPSAHWLHAREARLLIQSLAVQARLDYLVQHTTLAEQAGQLQADAAPPLARLGIPAYNFLNDVRATLAPGNQSSGSWKPVHIPCHPVLSQSRDAKTVRSLRLQDVHGVASGDGTIFPNGVSLGMSWDRDLLHRVGRAVRQRRPAVTRRHCRAGRWQCPPALIACSSEHWAPRSSGCCLLPLPQIGTEARGGHNGFVHGGLRGTGDMWAYNGIGITLYGPNMNLVSAFPPAPAFPISVDHPAPAPPAPPAPPPPPPQIYSSPSSCPCSSRRPPPPDSQLCAQVRDPRWGRAQV